MTGKQFKACAAVILAVLILPGCQATQASNPNGPTTVQLVASGSGDAIGVGAPSRPLPSHQAQGYRKTCMGFNFGLSGSDKAGLVVVLVLLAPVFLVGGLLQIFG